VTRPVSPPVRLSILDRLIDEAPRVFTEPQLTHDASVRALRASIRRDLEWLFNARRVHNPDPVQYKQSAASALSFGLPDTSAMTADSPDTRRGMARHLADAVAAFEPRLLNVRIVPLAPLDPYSRDLHFHVEGLMRMDPEPVHVTFDARMESSTGRCHVAGDSRA
jgi:type VI secretion system protein ImpF